jgi:hypothetical protein
MDLGQPVAAVLWAASEHLIFPILDLVAPLLLSVAIGHYLIRARKQREAKAQRLTAEIDDLRQRLDFIQATTVAVTIQFDGTGPFQLPLLTEMHRLAPKNNDRLVAGFRLDRNGKRVLAEISYRAVAQLLNGDRSMPLNKAKLSTPRLLELAEHADVHELPLLARFEGHMQRGRDLRILVFSCEKGRQILLPVPFETYQSILREFAAAQTARQRAT